MDQPTSSPTTPVRTSRLSFGRFLFGFLILLIGLQFLAINLGWHWTWVPEVWRFWPILIIALGLSVFFRGHPARWIGRGILVAALVLIVMAGLFTPTRTSNDRAGTIAVPLDPAATALSVDMNVGATKITLGGTNAQAFDGRYRIGGGDVSVEPTVEETVQRLSIKQTGSGWWFRPHDNAIAVDLNDQLPADVTIASGATDIHVDARQVKLQTLSVKTGASTVDAHFGDALDRSAATIEAGASSIHLHFPSTLGVVLHLESGLSGRTLKDFSDRGDGRWESANLEHTTKRLDVTLKIGVSSVTADWE